MKSNAKILVAGHRGLLGRALVRRLQQLGHGMLQLPRRAELDLEQDREVDAFFARERPDYVFMAAARGDGIVVNRRRPADFISANLAIQLAVVGAADRYGVQGLLLFGSSCMYPPLEERAIREEDLLSGPLEPTSQAYAVSKLAGVELCRAYRSQLGRRFFVMVPATLYGPDDHFGTEHAHVIPALIDRMHRAKLEGRPAVRVLGSGRPLREFLHSDDAAEAACLLMRSEESLDLVNVGSGQEVSIRELAGRIAHIVGYPGEIHFDAAAPDGAARKLLDSSRMLSLGWRPRIALDDGLAAAYASYRARAAAPTEIPDAAA